MIPLRIITLLAHDEGLQRQAAALLVEGFQVHWPNTWPTMDAALEEVREALAPDKICRVAIDEANTMLGWVGAIPEYETTAWELHPLKEYQT